MKTAIDSEGQPVEIPGMTAVRLVTDHEYARMESARRFQAATHAAALIHPEGPLVCRYVPQRPYMIAPLITVEWESRFTAHQWVDGSQVVSMQARGTTRNHLSIRRARELRDALDAVIAEAEAAEAAGSPESDAEQARRLAG